MSDSELRGDASLLVAPRPEPVRRLGEAFFDQLVERLYSPALVRRTLYLLVQEQYAEADRIMRLRGWGGAQPHGNDRYQYSREQARTLSNALPGAELLQPRQSLLYRIANAVVYPMRYGLGADDCPTSAQINDTSAIQGQLANGYFEDQLTLFDPDPRTAHTVVWLLFTGNNVDSGPLASYLALPGGYLADRRVRWLRIEPLLTDSGLFGSDAEEPADDRQRPALTSLPPEPSLALNLRP